MVGVGELSAGSIVAIMAQTVRRLGQHTQAETSSANRAKDGAVKHPEAEARISS